MQTMAREAWTDERLDDLKGHMDEGFRELRADIRSLRSEMSEVRAEIGDVRAEIGEVRAEIGAVREEVGELRGEMKAGFAALNRTLQIATGLIGTMFIALMTLIGTQL